MAESYGFFNGIEYGESFVALVNKTLVKTGVFLDGLKCFGSGMNVIVPSGSANINGFIYNNSENLELSIDTAHASLPRKDSVMIRHNISGRSINAVVVKGTPQSNPVAPEPVRDSSWFDLKIAEILIPAGAASVSTITDTRADDTVCGLVAGYDTADLTEILSKINALETRDYVVEQGTSGIWTYRKWNSGVAECWGISDQTISATQVWESGWFYGNGKTETYPFEFSEIPSCTYDKSKYGGMQLLASGSAGTTTHTPLFRLITPKSKPSIVTSFSIYAIGRWK